MFPGDSVAHQVRLQRRTGPELESYSVLIPLHIPFSLFELLSLPYTHAQKQALANLPITNPSWRPDERSIDVTVSSYILFSNKSKVILLLLGTSEAIQGIFVSAFPLVSIYYLLFLVSLPLSELTHDWEGDSELLCQKWDINVPPEW